MSVNKDNIKLGERYQMIVEGRQQDILEEGIKDVVLAGLLGLMAMTSVQGKDITQDTGRNQNKTQIQQMVQSSSNIDQLKKVILQVVDSQLKADQDQLKELQQSNGQPDPNSYRHTPLDNSFQINLLQDHIQELQQLQKEIQHTTDAGQIANLVHNAQISSQNIHQQQDMNSLNNIGGSLRGIQSAVR